MKFFRALQKLAALRFAVVMVLVGVLFAAIGGYITFGRGETVECDAYLTEEPREEKNPADDTTVYYAEVAYTVDGKEYRAELPVDSWKVTGDTIRVEYDPADPSRVGNAGSTKISVIFMIIGIVAAVGGVAFAVRAVRSWKEDKDEYDRADLSRVTDDVRAATYVAPEDRTNYQFRFAGKLNQGHLVEDEAKTAVYEVVMRKMTFFKPFTMDFVNHLTGHTATHQIGHTVTRSVGTSGGGNFSGSIPLSRAISVDGMNCWDYLAREGYGFEMELKGIRPCYRIKRWGEEIAYAETVGSDILKEGRDCAIGKLPVNGLFKFSCRPEDLDGVVMILVCISRAIFFDD